MPSFFIEALMGTNIVRPNRNSVIEEIRRLVRTRDSEDRLRAVRLAEKYMLSIKERRQVGLAGGMVIPAKT